MGIRKRIKAESMHSVSNVKKRLKMPSHYLSLMGDKVNKPGTSQKSYWKIINRILNKCRAPKIPPLFINNQFILDCKEKA